LRSVLLSAPIAAGSSILNAPKAIAYPAMVGMNGVCANAANLASYISANYPGVSSIGGIRPDRLPDHPSGRAIDIMVGPNTKLGNAIASDIRNQWSRFGVKYMLWQVPAHYDHIHVTVQ